MRRIQLFSKISGYDPGVSEFHNRPAATFDVVTCLDVLDTVEARFVEAVLEDISRLTRIAAVFDCMTRPPPNTFPSHLPFYWQQLVQKRMRIVTTSVEFPGVDRFERVIITAEPSQ
jgi:hypothetical protein